jgi:hypothetical protein
MSMPGKTSLGLSMTKKTMADCARCRFLAECDAFVPGGVHRHQDEPDPFSPPIIDAEKGNEFLQKVLESRGQAGSGILTMAAELELVYQKK